MYIFKTSRISTDEKSWNLSLFYRFSYYIIQPPVRVFSFSEQLFWLWSNWSHGPKGRISEFFYFRSVPYIVIIRKKCLGPVTVVLVAELDFDIFSLRNFPRASDHLPGERDVVVLGKNCFTGDGDVQQFCFWAFFFIFLQIPTRKNTLGCPS